MRGIDLNPRIIGDCDKDDEKGKVNIISVDINPGLPPESVKVRCKNDSQPPADVIQVIWVGTFGEFHSDETDLTGSIVISEWEPDNGSLLARKTYSRNGLFDGFPMTERTTINLWHRPE